MINVTFPLFSQDCEVEIGNLKSAVSEKEAETAAVEERCTHLVRLGEQRNQEIKTLQAQLVGVQDRAKDMLLSQARFLLPQHAILIVTVRHGVSPFKHFAAKRQFCSSTGRLIQKHGRRAPRYRGPTSTSRSYTRSSRSS